MLKNTRSSSSLIWNKNRFQTSQTYADDPQVKNINTRRENEKKLVAVAWSEAKTDSNLPKPIPMIRMTNLSILDEKISYQEHSVYE